MSITKPYTFTAGTKARAAEVNADFDALYSQVNINISDIAQNASDITSLDNNKANINGATANRFAVADPVSSSDAVNKGTLNKAISNSVWFISGLVVEVDSGSPSNTILVSPGTCYDSTGSVVLDLPNSTSKQNSTQAANAIYYIYIIGNSTGSTTDILISTSQYTPTLPSGYTLYRQIGFYSTNGSALIDAIYFYGINPYSAKSSNFLATTVMPDYSRKQYMVNNTEMIAPENGYLAIETCSADSSMTAYIRIGYSSNNYTINFSNFSNVVSGCFCVIPIPKGVYFKSDNIDNVHTALTYYFVPCKGGN